MREQDQAAVGKRIARLLAAEITERASKREFGVVAHDIEPLDGDELLAALTEAAEADKLELRVALVGMPDVVERGLKRSKLWKARLSADEEAAVAWRNKHQRTIAVVATRQLAREASLRALLRIDEKTLFERLCDEEQRSGPPVFRQHLWAALARQGDVITLPALVAYSEALRQLQPKDQSLRAPKLLHHLGLFPDEHLADQTSERVLARRLRLNAELLNEIRHADQDEWARVREFIKKNLDGAERCQADTLRMKLQSLSGDGGEALTGLDVSQAESVWRCKRRGAPGSAGADPLPAPRDEHLPAEHAVASLLIDQHVDRLRDIADEITQIVQHAEREGDEPDAPEVHGLRQGSRRSTVPTHPALLALVRDSSTEATWGCTYQGATDRIDILIDRATRHDPRPLLFADLRERLQPFIEQEMLPPNVQMLADRLAALRAELLPHLGQLLTAPICFLAGYPELCKKAEAYLSTYENLLQSLQASFASARADAEEEADALVAWMLAMEVYIFKTDAGTQAVLSPIHPLHLWRSVIVVNELLHAGRELGQQEREALQKACAEELHLLQVLCLPPSAASTETGQPILLGQAGRIGRLPVYREAPRGVYDAGGSRTVAQLAQALAQLRPFARPGLQVMLVNPPRPGTFVEALLGPLDTVNTDSADTYHGLHLRIRYTTGQAQAWAAELEDLDETVSESLALGRERGLASLSNQKRPVSWEEIDAELERRPAHLLVIVDPFEVRSSPFSRTGINELSPWVLTREYKYNKFRREITVVPVADSFVFGAYLNMIGLLDPTLKQKNPANLPQVGKVRDILNKLGARTLWTVLLDPHRVALARLGDAEVIDRRVEGARQVTCYARDLMPFTRQLDQQLRRTHFTAEASTLLQLVRDLAAMEPAGILRLGPAGADGRGIKGSLGKLVATRWYRQQVPSGLAVSLDTPEGRQWLVAGRDSRVQADLIGLQEDQGTLTIDVIEVKAHDDSEPYQVSEDGTIRGQPVEQVLATLRAVAEIFTKGTDRSPLVRPRREVLREHLYTAVLRDADSAFMERWYALLNDLFAGQLTVRLRGRIIHIHLASVAEQAPAVYLTADRVPVLVETLSAHDVGLMLSSLRGRGEAEGAPARPAAPAATIDSVVGPSELLRLLLPGAEAPAAAAEPPAAAPARSPASEQGDVAEHVYLEPPIPHRPAGRDEAREARPAYGGAAASAQPGLSLEVDLGNETPSGRSVVWQPGKQGNGFFIILGSSGSGKTETLKVLIDGIRRAGIPVLIFDFHGDVRTDGMRSELLSHSPVSRVGLNPMELDSKEADYGPYLQRQALKDMLTSIVPELGHKQGPILKQAFEEAYRRAGILDDDMATWGREPPTFAAVEAILDDWFEDDAKRSLRSSIEGCRSAVRDLFEHPLFRRQPRLSLDQILRESARLDLATLTDSVRFVVTDTLLRKIFRALRAQGPIPVQPRGDHERFRLFVVIDEAKILSLGAERDSAKALLNVLTTEARKFGLGLILATQMADHLSDEVRANAATWLVLRPNDIKEAKKNAPNVHVEPDDLLRLNGSGDGYLRDRSFSSGKVRRIQVRSLAADASSAARTGAAQAG